MTAGGPKPTPEPLRPGLANAIESDRERALKRIVPWVVSAGLHGGLIGLGFLLTWTVISIVEDEDPIRVTADFYTVDYDPLTDLPRTPTPSEQTSVPTPTEVQAMQLSRAEQISQLEFDPLHLLVDVAAPAPMGSFTPATDGDSATFVGLTSTNARRIVYCIDASGSMMSSLQVVLGELDRSLGGLKPPQEFAIVFFQRNEAVAVPPGNSLVSATRNAKVAALQWIHDEVIPSGRSSPIAAIRHALGLEPDVIFLLSENITGTGKFEIDQLDLLTLLDRANPFDKKTGRRPVRINCVQFLYPDPLDTLRRIATAHGGPDGYKFLDAAELGIVAP